MVGRPARRPDRTTVVNSGRRRRRACAGNTSGGELLATLAPTTGEDRPARAGPHPQPEAVGLRPTAVVRLERALAHEVLPLHDIDGAHPSVDGCTRGAGTTAAGRAPALPEAGSADSALPAPSTDSDQHNRGTAAPGGRPDPTAHGPPGLPHRHDGTPGPVLSGVWTTRRDSPPERCPAVDRAVSVAVAPRRTSGSRREGRPRWSTDRRIARFAGRTGPRSAEMPIAVRIGPESGPTRRRSCTACGHRCGTSASAHPQGGTSPVGPRGRHDAGQPAPEIPGSTGDRLFWEDEPHGRCHAGPGDGLGPDP